MSLTVALDARPLLDPGGEAFAYTLNLLHGLMYIDRGLRLHLFVDRQPEPALLPIGDVAVTVLRAPAALWKTTQLGAAAKTVGADLLHVQGLLPVAPQLPVVTTLRHLQPQWPATASGRCRRWAWQALLPRQLPRAAAVLVPWEAVRRQVCERYGVRPARVTVTPYGAEPAFRPQCISVQSAVKEVLALPARYVVGRGDGARDVYDQARTAGLDAELVLFEGADTYRTLAGLEPPQYGAVLASSLACILGGTGEAARLAMLESMAAGTPVVGTGDEVLAEIAGHAAVLGSPEAQAVALALWSPNGAERAAQVQAGLERAKEFTWPAMAEKTLAAYQAALAV